MRYDSEARIIRRPARLMAPAVAAATAWARAFGSIDTIGRCECCGSGLTRRAVLTGTGNVYGIDCAVNLKIIAPRVANEKPRFVYTPRPNELAWIDRCPVAWAACCAAADSNDARRAAWIGAGGHPRIAATMSHAAYMLSR
jgi:hypothetical protein